MAWPIFSDMDIFFLGCRFLVSKSPVCGFFEVGRLLFVGV